MKLIHYWNFSMCSSCLFFTEFVLLIRIPPFYEVNSFDRKWQAHGGFFNIFFLYHFSPSFLGQNAKVSPIFHFELDLSKPDLYFSGAFGGLDTQQDRKPIFFNFWTLKKFQFNQTTFFFNFFKRSHLWFFFQMVETSMLLQKGFDPIYGLLCAFT